MIANGKYNKDGQEKTNWVKIGIIGVGQNGKEYMMLDPTINLAGFQREQGRDMVMVSIFEEQPQNLSHNSGQPQQNNQQPYGQPQQHGQYNAPQVVQQNVPMDNVPF